MTMAAAHKFHKRLRDAQRWLRHNASSGTLRSKGIAPEQSLFDAFKSGTTADESLRRQIAVVESVVLRRSERLTEAHELDANEGRLLAVELPASMYDGVASSISDGFYDECDAPPWDTWITVAILGDTGYLLSWIPSDHFLQATAGVDANGGQCIRWVDVDEMTEAHVRKKLSS